MSDNVLQRLDSLQRIGIKLGLRNIKSLLETRATRKNLFPRFLLPAQTAKDPPAQCWMQFFVTRDFYRSLHITAFAGFAGTHSYRRADYRRAGNGSGAAICV